MKQFAALKGWSYARIVDELRAVAGPGELDATLSLSTIERHVNGKHVPPPILQALYDRATEGAVRPQDWVDLFTRKASTEATVE